MKFRLFATLPLFLCLTPIRAFGSDRPSIPLADVVVEDITANTSSGTYQVHLTGHFVVAGEVDSFLEPDFHAYVTKTAYFDPNGPWDEASVRCTAVPGKGRSLVTFDFALPNSFATTPDEAKGILAITLPGQIHGRTETSIAAVPFPTEKKATTGSLYNTLVPITLRPETSAAGITNDDRFNRRGQATIYLNEPWGTWRPWVEDSRPRAYVLLSGDPLLKSGAWGEADMDRDPDLGVWGSVTRPEALVRYYRPSIDKDYAMIICLDRTYVNSTQYVDQYSGIILRVGKGKEACIDHGPDPIPATHYLTIVMDGDDTRLPTLTAGGTVLHAQHGLNDLITALNSVGSSTFDRLEFIGHGNPYVCGYIDSEALSNGPLTALIRKVLKPGAEIVLTSCNSGVQGDSNCIAATVAAATGHRTYGSRGYVTVGTWSGNSIEVNSTDTEKPGGFATETFIYDDLFKTQSGNRITGFQGYCPDSIPYQSLTNGKSIDLSTIPADLSNKLQSFLFFPILNNQLLASVPQTLIAPELEVHVRPATPTLQEGTYNIFCNGTVVQFIGRTAGGGSINRYYVSPNNPGMQAVKYLWTPVTSQSSTVLYAGVDDSSFVRQDVPTNVFAGADFNASITFRNTGNRVWTDTDGYELRSPDQTWSGESFNYAKGEQTEPDDIREFHKTLIAPSIPGNYTFRWHLVHNGNSFGASSSLFVLHVLPAEYSASISGPPSTSVPAGQVDSSILVHVTNRGQATWSYLDGICLSVTDDHSNETLYSLSVGQLVKPQDGLNFTVTVSRPNGDPISRAYRIRMVRGAAQKFGQGFIANVDFR